MRRTAGLRAFTGGCGAEVRFEYGIVLPNVINLRNAPVGEIARIKALPGVVKVEDDLEVHAYLQDCVPLIRGLQTPIATAVRRTARSSAIETAQPGNTL